MEPLEQGVAFWFSCCPGLEGRFPFGPSHPRAFRKRSGVRDGVIVHLEMLIGVESQNLLRLGDFLGANGGAVNFAGVHFLGRRPPDDGFDDDQARSIQSSLGLGDGGVQPVHVFAVVVGSAEVHGVDIPAVGLVAGGDVFGEGNIGVVFDGDFVGVVEDNESSKLLVASKRGRFARHTLLDIAVARDDIGEVVKGRLALWGVWVEQSSFEALGIGEARRGGEALAEGSCRDFHTGGVPVFRVSRGEGTPGAKGLQIIQLQATAAQIQLHVLGERGVARGENKAVPADPVRISGV